MRLVFRTIQLIKLAFNNAAIPDDMTRIERDKYIAWVGHTTYPIIRIIHFVFVRNLYFMFLSCRRFVEKANIKIPNL